MTPTPAEVVAAWTGPDPAPDPGNCPVCGRDSCEDHLTPAGRDRVTDRAQERPPLRARQAFDLLSEQRPVAVVEGLAWVRRKAVLVSESGGSKTFVVLSVGAAVGDNREWCGRAVRHGSVAYVSYEGDALGLRLRALHEAGFTLKNLHVIRATEPLSPRVGRDGVEGYSIGEARLSEALAELAARLKAEGHPELVLVIIDTIRASLAGSEDRSEEVAAYLRAVDRILAPHPQAGCILAHHAGWQDGEVKRLEVTLSDFALARVFRVNSTGDPITIEPFVR